MLTKAGEIRLTFLNTKQTLKNTNKDYRLIISICYCISYKDQWSDLKCKSNDWFLHKMQDCGKID